MFDESKVNRDNFGQFAEKSTSELKEEKIIELKQKYDDELHIKNINHPQKTDLDNLYGKEYKGYKGQAAVEKLLKEKQGHIKGAFFREDMGEIDLFWGNENLGLSHIIRQREKDGINVPEFLSNLAEVVECGEYKGKNKNNTFEYWYKGKMVVISPEYHENKVTFLLTAFNRKKNKGSHTATL